jgi:hypothetical protein
MWSRGRRFDVHVTTLAARHCLHARLPSPTPRPCRFWRPVGVGARQSCAEWPFSDDRGVRSREEMRSTRRRRRRHRSHSSRQAFRHFGTRLTPVHRMNGPRAIGVRRPSCSYLCLAVPSGSQAFSFRFQALRRRLCRLRPRDCCEHREFETRYGSLRFFCLVHRRKTCALASRTVLLLEETNSSLSSSALSPFLLLPAYICP